MYRDIRNILKAIPSPAGRRRPRKKEEPRGRAAGLARVTPLRGAPPLRWAAPSCVPSLLRPGPVFVLGSQSG